MKYQNFYPDFRSVGTLDSSMQMCASAAEGSVTNIRSFFGCICSDSSIKTGTRN